MLLCVCDIETTGLDPGTCGVLEIGAVMFDTCSLATVGSPFSCLVRPHDGVRWEPAAREMNDALFGECLASGVSGSVAMMLFRQWLGACGDPDLTFCGSNFGKLDWQFLSRMPQWDRVCHSHRFLDVGSLFFNPDMDSGVPSTAECCRRAGLSPAGAEHRALTDCQVVVELLRYLWRIA